MFTTFEPNAADNGNDHPAEYKTNVDALVGCHDFMCYKNDLRVSVPLRLFSSRRATAGWETEL